jgi:hypothetical protein
MQDGNTAGHVARMATKWKHTKFGQTNQRKKNIRP